MAKHRLGNTQNEYFEIEQPDNAGASKITSTELISKATPVANRQALIARVGTFDGEAVWQSDIGLMYIWKSSGVIENGGTQIGTGAGWVADIKGKIDARIFGANETRTDNDVPIQSALAVGETFIPKGEFKVSNPIKVLSNQVLTGAGIGVTTIKANSAMKCVIQLSTTDVGVSGGLAITNMECSGFTIDGDNLSNLGLFSNYVTMYSNVKNIYVTGTLLYGILIGKAWYANYDNIIARGCKHCGIGIGVQYLDSFDDTAVTDINLTNIRAHSITDSTDTDLQYNLSTYPQGSCGIHFKGKSVTSLNQVSTEHCDGTGLFVDADAYCNLNMREIYSEGNLGVAEIILNNRVTTNSYVTLDGVYLNTEKLHYIDNGGSLKYTIRNSRSIILTSSVAGMLPITFKEVPVLSIPSDNFLYSTTSINKNIVQSDTSFTPGISEVYPKSPIRGFNNGDSVLLCSLQFDPKVTYAGAFAVLNIDVSAIAKQTDETYISQRTISANIALNVLRRWSTGAVTAESVTVISDTTTDSGNSVLTTMTVSVAWDSTDEDRPKALIKVLLDGKSFDTSYTSIGAIISNKSSALRNGSVSILANEPLTIV